MQVLPNGTGVAKDPARAAQLFTRTCDAGLAVGCGALAYLHAEGIAVPKDDDRAASLHQRACDAPELDTWNQDTPATRASRNVAVASIQGRRLGGSPASIGGNGIVSVSAVAPGSPIG